MEIQRPWVLRRKGDKPHLGISGFSLFRGHWMTVFFIFRGKIILRSFSEGGYYQITMKTKTQKGEELKTGKKLLEKSQILIFTDFSKVKTADVRKLRQQLKEVQAKYFVIKKRLLALILKEQGIEVDVKGLGTQIGTIFSETDIEKSSAPVYKFFYGIGGDTKAGRTESVKKIVGAYDLKKKNFIEAKDVLFIGQLPSREVLLGQLFGMIAAPISSLLYVLNERAKQTVETK